MNFKRYIKSMISAISPTLITRIMYRANFHQKLNLNKPQNICEKMLWLKLNTYYNNPIITQCVDKYKVREYIQEKGCAELLNELIGVYDKVEEIQWENLPEQFVLKCNHGCKYNLICEDKSTFDIEQAKGKLRSWMKEDFWKIFGEVNYKYVAKKIVCEAYLNDGLGKSLRDYKFYCINGEPKLMEVCMNRQENSGHPDEYFFDMDYNYQPPQMHNSGLINGKLDELPRRPISFEKMKEYARILSVDFPFVRVDFYEVNRTPVFSELTFTSAAGYDKELMDACPYFGEELEVKG